MENKEILRKLRSIELCLTAHPDCEKGSEFKDRVIDLQEIQQVLTIPVVAKSFVREGSDISNMKKVYTKRPDVEKAPQ